MPRPPGPVLFDPTARLLARFGAAGMPALYVIDGAGIVRAVESGYDAARVTRLATVIDSLLPADDGTRRAESSDDALVQKGESLALRARGRSSWVASSASA